MIYDTEKYDPEVWGVGELCGKLVFMSAEEVELSADAEDWAAREWSVTVECEDRSMEFPIYGGRLVFNVLPHEVLEGFAIDAWALDLTFEDWADEYGYDEDSRKAYRTWEKWRKLGREFLAVLGVAAEELGAVDFEELSA